MIEFDYIEEANKLKQERDFGFDFYNDYNTSYKNQDEKILYEICKKYDLDLEDYQNFINDILDKLEKDKIANKIKDNDDLGFKYRYYLGRLCNYFTSGFHHELLYEPKESLSLLESIL